MQVVHRLDKLASVASPAVGWWESGPVVEDLLDALLDFRSELLQGLDGVDVALDLLRLGGSEDTSGHVGVRDRPCQSEVGHASAKLLGDLCQLSDLLELRFALLRLQSLGSSSGSTADVDVESGTFWDTVVVLAGEDTLVERGEDGASVTLPPPEGVVLGLESLSVKHGVVALVGSWTNEVESPGDLVGL